MGSRGNGECAPAGLGGNHLDYLIAEDLALGGPVARMLWSQLGESRPPSRVKVRFFSRRGSDGCETDTLVDAQNFVLLIESKRVSDQFRPGQAEGYRDEVRRLEEEDPTKEVRAVLFAAADWLKRTTTTGFTKVSFEDAVRAYKEAAKAESSSGLRRLYEWRAEQLDLACKPTQGYRPPSSTPSRREIGGFWDGDRFPPERYEELRQKLCAHAGGHVSASRKRDIEDILSKGSGSRVLIHWRSPQRGGAWGSSPANPNAWKSYTRSSAPEARTMLKCWINEKCKVELPVALRRRIAKASLKQIETWFDRVAGKLRDDTLDATSLAVILK